MRHKVIAECIDRFTGQRLMPGTVYPLHPRADPEARDAAVAHLKAAGCLIEISDDRAAEIERQGQGGAANSAGPGADLYKLTVAELKKIAEAEKIELDADFKKAEIVEAIRSARATA